MFDGADERACRVTHMHDLIVGFGTATGENHLVGGCAQKGGKLAAGILDRLSGMASGTVNGGRVSDTCHGFCQRCNHLRADLCGGVIVQIEAVGHSGRKSS